MKNQIKLSISEAIKKLYPDVEVDFSVDYAPKNIEADFASNIAMALARKIGKNPMDIANEIANGVKGSKGFNVKAAPPGFLNFKLADEIWQKELKRILKEKDKYGQGKIGKGIKVNIESVSANPTGPLTVGHGRGAVLGQVLANVMAAQGFKVKKDYYYNDAGLQMKKLGESVRLRALELKGESTEFPEDLYQGEYIKEIAKEWVEGGKGEKREQLAEFAAEKIFAWIKDTLGKLGVTFDKFVKESEQKTKKTLKLLEKAGIVYEKDGAKWLKNREGREDRVLVRKTGEPTYRLPDIAYHLKKVKKYNRAITVLGADHIGQFPDIAYAVEKLGGDAEKIEVLINQFVTLAGGNLSAGSKARKMSTRKAEYVTLSELIEEVGADVTKFFFAMNSASSHMNFDLDLARERSEKNPLYKVQYASARIHSILEKSQIINNKFQTPHQNKFGTGQANSPASTRLGETGKLQILNSKEELALIKELAKFSEVIAEISQTYNIHYLPHYLLGLADAFHSFYEKVRVLTDDKDETAARLAQVKAVQTVLANGLRLMGIEPLQKM